MDAEASGFAAAHGSCSSNNRVMSWCCGSWNNITQHCYGTATACQKCDRLDWKHHTLHRSLATQQLHKLKHNAAPSLGFQHSCYGVMCCAMLCFSVMCFQAIDPHLLLLIFLPTIGFSAALGQEPHLLRRNWGQVGSGFSGFRVSGFRVLGFRGTCMSWGALLRRS